MLYLMVDAILGGYNDVNHILSSSEMYHSEFNSFLPGPELPYGLFRHCMVKINQTHFALIGGRIFKGSSYQPTNQAFIYNSGASSSNRVSESFKKI